MTPTTQQFIKKPANYGMIILFSRSPLVLLFHARCCPCILYWQENRSWEPWVGNTLFVVFQRRCLLQLDAALYLVEQPVSKDWNICMHFRENLLVFQLLIDVLMSTFGYKERSIRKYTFDDVFWQQTIVFGLYLNRQVQVGAARISLFFLWSWGSMLAPSDAQKCLNLFIRVSTHGCVWCEPGIQLLGFRTVYLDVL